VKRSSGYPALRTGGLTLVLCCGILFATQAQKSKSPERISASIPVFATIETSVGSFEIELYPDDAPRTVENFVKLAEQKYFDGTRIHRVSRSQGVIQMGDDKSRDTAKVKEWGTGGRSAFGKDFNDELDSTTPSYKEGYKKGVVAMANRGPNTNTSQFFIMLKDLPFMPKNYTIFGKVIRGIKVLDSIGRVEIIPQLGVQDGRPKVHLLVKKITIRQEPLSKPAEKK
jgi:cyclophilin family peptidyl-prolyl cis-trans isomerase